MQFSKAVSNFGASAKAKLKDPVVEGAREDQLRAPLENFFDDIAAALGQKGALRLIGEATVEGLSSRPDYAVTRKKGGLIGHIEIKAPGKGADPRTFKGRNSAQWENLKRLPNLIYTDGNAFSLWRDGELIDSVVNLEGGIEKAGAKLTAPPAFEGLITDFLSWEPAPPRSTKQLAAISARLCRLLREEVTEAVEQKNEALTDLASDWRDLLFPKATNAQFADGYAQAVTFGLLIAKAEGISLAKGVESAALDLRKSKSLIGAALRLLTDSPETQKALETSLGTLMRVLDVVDWPVLTKGESDAWLYFYEDFLEVYDNEIRKQTGSYYTPVEVVEFMVHIVDDVLKNPKLFGCGLGFADSKVKIADPAAGGGAYLLGVLRRIAKTVEEDVGPGAVKDGIRAASKRLFGFEAQFGPFAVAQLRLMAEFKNFCNGKETAPEPRLYITDTLGDPYAEETNFPSMLEPIGASRRDANAIKRDEKITVVIGNPPYKEKAKGLGGWIETGSDGLKSPLRLWMPEKEWGAHAKHLYNLYVYFWRWAAWKVFGSGYGATTGKDEEPRSGVVCFISASGFLNGDGFRTMRADLRRECSDIWVIDCSPEGHQPDVPTRIFEDVQQPLCIAMAVSPPDVDKTRPARVRFTTLPAGRRGDKFKAMAALKLSGAKWENAPKDWDGPFLPEARGDWGLYPQLENLFVYNGSGVMAGRTWVMAPDAESLKNRWSALIAEKRYEKKEKLFHPHLVKERERESKSEKQVPKDGPPKPKKMVPGDRHIRKMAKRHLPQIPAPVNSIESETGGCVEPVRYAYRSFDRQWIIPDARLINRPNPALWTGRSDRQVYLTSLKKYLCADSPAGTFCGLIPDLDHCGDRVFPMWLDAEASQSNIKPGLLAYLSELHGRKISPEDVMAYIACVYASPAFITRFKSDLRQAELRLPITADQIFFKEAVSVGCEVIWLHTYGERFHDAKAERPKQYPRMAKGEGPLIPKGGAIPGAPAPLPDNMSHDAAAKTLFIGGGCVKNVSSAMWNYQVAGKNVLNSWFGYRKQNRGKPPMQNRRPPSPLQSIQPDSWPPEYTEDLLNLLHVLGRIIALEPKQADILQKICAGPLVENKALEKAGAFEFKHKKEGNGEE